jgi:hypothetical protein
MLTVAFDPHAPVAIIPGGGKVDQPAIVTDHDTISHAKGLAGYRIDPSLLYKPPLVLVQNEFIVCHG